MKIGLALEGGAMRGMFTAGILDIFLENDIQFDCAVGVSAGAAFGCNLKSKQIGRAIRYNMRFCNDKRYSGIKSLLTTGNLFNAEFCYNTVPLQYDPFDFETYDKNPMPFYIVCTDIESGEPTYDEFVWDETTKLDLIRASASMPIVSQIVELNGKKLLDGGISDPIPIRFLSKKGYEKNVVVLTQPLSYRKKLSTMMPLIKIVYRKYPKLVQLMQNRHLLYNETLDYILENEKKGSLFVIRPNEALPISRAEKGPQKLKVVYELGRKAGLSNLSSLKLFMNNEKTQ